MLKIIGFSVSCFLISGLIFVGSSSANMDCVAETSLPDDLTTVSPSSDIPENLTRFLGIWVGAWRDKGHDALCHRLVVKSVDASGAIKGIYSFGTDSGWNIAQRNFHEVDGQITDGKLALRPFRNGSKASYWFADDNLRGSFITKKGLKSDIAMTRQSQ